MPTLYSAWQQNDRVRFVLDYTVTKTNGGIDATLSGTVKMQTRYSLYDSNNSWSIGGNLQSKSGTNIDFSHGNSGDTTTIGSVSKSKMTGNGTVSVSVTGLAPYASTISASFTIPIGALAKQIDHLTPNNITQTTANVKAGSKGGNGTPNNLNVRYNTSKSATGEKSVTVGSWNSANLSGLIPGTTYYLRGRVSTSQYGWGPLSGWNWSFTTLPGAYVRNTSGAWRPAIPYVKYNNAWKVATPYVKVNNAWKVAGG